MRDAGIRTLMAMAVVCAAGCGSFRRIAPLDDVERAEMTSLRGKLAGRRFVVSNARGRDAPHPDLAAALGTLGVHVAKTGGATDVGAAEIDCEPIGHCANGMTITLLTLGVIPYPAPAVSDWRCRSVTSDRLETADTFHLDGTIVVGWFGLPLGLFPGWSAFVGFGERTEQKEAVRKRLALFLGRRLTSRGDRATSRSDDGPD